MSGESFSFVNENFDELQSDSSKDNRPQSVTPPIEQQSPRSESPVVEDDQTKPITDIDERDEGVAVLHLSSEHTPTLQVEDNGDKDEYNPFAPKSSPTPNIKSPTVAPSYAVASPNPVDGSEHRLLPQFDHTHQYESVGHFNTNELRHDKTDEYDLQISIVGHEKHVASKTDSYVLYKISTNSVRPRHLFEKCEYTVWRRYKDFEWLHSQFEKSYPTLILPPLPGKQIMRYFDHKNEQFIEERQKCLDQFLWRLASHPFYSYDHNFKMFLTASTEEFAIHVDSTTTSNSQFLGKMSSSVKMASTSFRLKNPDQKFANHGKYFTDLSEALGVIDRVETRLVTERASLASANEDMSALVYSWANSEPQLADHIRKMGACFEANASALSSLNHSNSASFQLAVKMYQLYSTSGASAVRRRDALQLEYETACDEKEKRKRAHDDAIKAGKRDKVPKLAAEMEKTGVAAEHAQDELMKANEQLRVDIEKWMESKDEQIGDIFRNWSDNYIQYHEKMFHEWEELLKMLRSIGQHDGDRASQLYETI